MCQKDTGEPATDYSDRRNRGRTETTLFYRQLSNMQTQEYCIYAFEEHCL